MTDLERQIGQIRSRLSALEQRSEPVAQFQARFLRDQLERLEELHSQEAAGVSGVRRTP